MITIYAKIDRDSAGEVMRIAQKALTVLQEALDHIEASGKSTAVERATLTQLQTRLSRLKFGVNDGCDHRIH